MILMLYRREETNCSCFNTSILLVCVECVCCRLCVFLRVQADQADIISLLSWISITATFKCQLMLHGKEMGNTTAQGLLKSSNPPTSTPHRCWLTEGWGMCSLKKNFSDLQCPHSHSDDLWTHWMQSTWDTFNLPIKVFNVCFLRGFLLLCWMNQSITELYAQTPKLGARAFRLVAGCELLTSEERLTRWVLQPGDMNEKQSVFSHSLHSNLGKDLKV